MIRRSLFLLLALASAAGISGCGKGGSKPSSTRNRVVEWELSDFQALNPFNSTDANATYTEELIYQRLITADPKTLQYNVPVIAESMPTESADHLQFDFTIRKDIKWPDGTQLTGNDVIFSLKSLKNPFNSQAGQKRVYVDPIHSAELIDGDPFRVRFKLWKPYFLIKQATFGDVLYILEKHVFDPNNLSDKYTWDDIASIVETAGNKEIDSVTLAHHSNKPMQDFSDLMSKSEINRSPQYIQGSGPYKLDAWVTQDYVRLVRNPNYVNHWGALGEANPDTLVFKTINDPSAAVTALKAQDIDLMGSLQPPFWTKLDTNKSGIRRTAFPLGSFAYLGFNHRNPIFRDRGVRWAMAYMIDRKTIIDKLLYGLATPCQSAVSQTHPECNRSLAAIPYDPNRAKAILDSLDWKDHDGDGIRDKMIEGKRVPFSFTFTVNAGNETRKQVLLVVAEALRKIGIKADVNALEWSVFIQRERDHQVDAHYGAWINDPFETDNYQLYHSSQAKNRGSNYDSYSNPEADKLMEAIRMEFDDAKRVELQKQLQKVMYDDQANLFLWEPMNCAAWRDRFDNVSWDSYRPGYDIANWRIRGVGTPKASAF